MPRFFSSLLREARALRPREAVRQVADRFDDNDLLTYASAISFRVLFALIPLALLGLGVLGTLGLEDVWREDVAPEVRDQVSPAAFTVIEQTVMKVLGEKQLFWATLGALIATWEMSACMRAVMGVLNRIYRVDSPRTWARRVFDSIWLGALVSAMLLAAVASVKIGPALLGGGVLLSLGGWLAALALLFATVAMIVRFAPGKKRPIRWVSFGAVLVVAGWIGASLVYGWYTTSIADYGSAFGSLAVVMVTLGFIYILSIVFLTGLQLDALARREVEQREADERVSAPAAQRTAERLTAASAEH